MVPIPAIAIVIAALVFLGRSNLAGLIAGGILTMALMHLWPGAFMPIFDWVGELIASTGLADMVTDVESDLRQ